MTQRQKTNESADKHAKGVSMSKSNGAKQAAEQVSTPEGPKTDPQTPPDVVKGALTIQAQAEDQSFTFTEDEQAAIRPLQAAVEAAQAVLADTQVEIMQLEAKRAEAAQNVVQAKKALSDGVISMFQNRKIPLDDGHWNVDVTAMTATRT